MKFGSNFQPFVRRRDVTHGADDDMVREPEMVQAYRDTWELGVHSFLTYLRDRLLLARELLHPSGSIFVQMSDTNLHHVREVMDEVFGAECFVSQISFQTTSGFQTRTLATLGDFLLWYARDPERLKVRKLFEEQPVVLGEGNARWVLEQGGNYRGVKAAEKRGEVRVPEGARLYKPDNLADRKARQASRNRSSSRAKSTSRAPTRTGSPTIRMGSNGLPPPDEFTSPPTASNTGDSPPISPTRNGAISGRTPSPAASPTRRCTSCRPIPRWSSAAC